MTIASDTAARARALAAPVRRPAPYVSTAPKTPRRVADRARAVALAGLPNADVSIPRTESASGRWFSPWARYLGAYTGIRP